MREWRAYFKDEATRLGIPPLNEVGIEVYVTSAIRTMPDTGACFSAQKAAVDGLRDAGVLIDDTGQYVKWLTFYPVEYKKGEDSLSVRIVELP